MGGARQDLYYRRIDSPQRIQGVRGGLRRGFLVREVRRGGRRRLAALPLLLSGHCCFRSLACSRSLARERLLPSAAALLLLMYKAPAMQICWLAAKARLAEKLACV